MDLLKWRALIATMWLLQAVNYAAYILISILENPPIEPLAPADGVLTAIFFFIPCLLAWLGFVVRPGISKWPHIVFGAVFFLLKAAATAGLVGASSMAVFINELWAAFAAALLIWYAWKAPAPAS